MNGFEAVFIALVSITSVYVLILFCVSVGTKVIDSLEVKRKRKKQIRKDYKGIPSQKTELAA